MNHRKRKLKYKSFYSKIMGNYRVDVLEIRPTQTTINYKYYQYDKYDNTIDRKTKIRLKLPYLYFIVRSFKNKPINTLLGSSVEPIKSIKDSIGYTDLPNSCEDASMCWGDLKFPKYNEKHSYEHYLMSVLNGFFGHPLNDDCGMDIDRLKDVCKDKDMFVNDSFSIENCIQDWIEGEVII